MCVGWGWVGLGGVWGVGVCLCMGGAGGGEKGGREGGEGGGSKAAVGVPAGSERSAHGLDVLLSELHTTPVEEGASGPADAEVNSAGPRTRDGPQKGHAGWRLPQQRGGSGCGIRVKTQGSKPTAATLTMVRKA